MILKLFQIKELRKRKEETIRTKKKYKRPQGTLLAQARKRPVAHLRIPNIYSPFLPLTDSGPHPSGHIIIPNLTPLLPHTVAHDLHSPTLSLAANGQAPLPYKSPASSPFSLFFPHLKRHPAVKITSRSCGLQDMALIVLMVNSNA
jgi:hypothetical protein